jgi:hypothetical protein
MKAATAFDVAKWSGLGLIAFYGFAAARLAGERLVAALRCTSLSRRSKVASTVSLTRPRMRIS